MDRSHQAPHAGRGHGRPASRPRGDARWNPEWDPDYRHERRDWWENHQQAKQNYGAFVARAPSRWDHAGNWWRKAPHRPEK